MVQPIGLLGQSELEEFGSVSDVAHVGSRLNQLSAEKKMSPLVHSAKISLPGTTLTLNMHKYSHIKVAEGECPLEIKVPRYHVLTIGRESGTR